MTLRNYFLIDKSDCLTLIKAPQFSRIVGNSLLQDRCENLRTPGGRVIVLRGDVSRGDVSWGDVSRGDVSWGE